MALYYDGFNSALSHISDSDLKKVKEEIKAEQEAKKQKNDVSKTDKQSSVSSTMRNATLGLVAAFGIYFVSANDLHAQNNAGEEDQTEQAEKKRVFLPTISANAGFMPIASGDTDVKGSTNPIGGLSVGAVFYPSTNKPSTRMQKQGNVLPTQGLMWNANLDFTYTAIGTSKVEDYAYPLEKKSEVNFMTTGASGGTTRMPIQDSGIELNANVGGGVAFASVDKSYVLYDGIQAPGVFVDPLGTTRQIANNPDATAAILKDAKYEQFATTKDQTLPYAKFNFGATVPLSKRLLFKAFGEYKVIMNGGDVGFSTDGITEYGQHILQNSKAKNHLHTGTVSAGLTFVLGSIRNTNKQEDKIKELEQEKKDLEANNEEKIISDAKKLSQSTNLAVQIFGEAVKTYNPGDSLSVITTQNMALGGMISLHKQNVVLEAELNEKKTTLLRKDEIIAELRKNNQDIVSIEEYCLKVLKMKKEEFKKEEFKKD